MLKLNKIEDKDTVISKTLLIINKYNSIHKSIVNNLKKFEKNDNTKKEYYNYYNNFINKNQNVKKLILYFYKLGLALIKEKTETDKKTEELLNNFKFQELIIFNMGINRKYEFTTREIEKLKTVNKYFDELYLLDDNITKKLKEDFIKKMKQKQELKEKLKKKINKPVYIKKDTELELELEKLLTQTLILKNKIKKIKNNEDLPLKKKIKNKKTIDKKNDINKIKIDDEKKIIKTIKKNFKKNSSKNIKLLDITV